MMDENELLEENDVVESECDSLPVKADDKTTTSNLDDTQVEMAVQVI